MQILKESSMMAFNKTVEKGPKWVIDTLKNKGLTGRGGAGFPTGTKWEMVFNEKETEKYVVCNADEGEPGTFKDRMIIEKNPKTLIEGIMIACHVITAKKAFIYLRGEYECLKENLQKTIDEVNTSDIEIQIFQGAGAYVCGDETAILRSIEGYRGHPSLKPPFPTVQGLFEKPTIINNVETLTNVPLALMMDDWDPKLKLFSLSGKVKHPGVYELKEGTPLSKLIKLGDGEPKAIHFGCFGGCLAYEQFKDIPLTPEEVLKADCFLGSCAVIVTDKKTSIIDVATNIAKFYEFESCGKCTPCREGTMRVLAILENIAMGQANSADIDTLLELAIVIRDTSFCGLGQTATNHVINAIKYFREEFEERLCKSE